MEYDQWIGTVLVGFGEPAYARVVLGDMNGEDPRREYGYWSASRRARSR